MFANKLTSQSSYDTEIEISKNSLHLWLWAIVIICLQFTSNLWRLSLLSNLNRGWKCDSVNAVHRSHQNSAVLTVWSAKLFDTEQIERFHGWCDWRFPIINSFLWSTKYFVKPQIDQKTKTGSESSRAPSGAWRWTKKATKKKVWNLNYALNSCQKNSFLQLLVQCNGRRHQSSLQSGMMNRYAMHERYESQTQKKESNQKYRTMNRIKAEFMLNNEKLHKTPVPPGRKTSSDCPNLIIDLLSAHLLASLSRRLCRFDAFQMDTMNRASQRVNEKRKWHHEAKKAFRLTKLELEVIFFATFEQVPKPNESIVRLC